MRLKDYDVPKTMTMLTGIRRKISKFVNIELKS